MRLARCSVLWLVLGACGFHPGVGHDPPRDDAPSVTALEAGPAGEGGVVQSCVLNWFGDALHFSPPRKVMGLSTNKTERDPVLSQNQLQIWFQSDRPGSTGGGDVYTATRSSTADPFGMPVPVAAPGVNSPQADGKYALTANELSYVISSNRTGTKGGFDLWLSHRDTGGEDFPAPDNALLGTVDDGMDQYDPWLNDEGTHLYYAPYGATQRIYLATRADFTATFDPPAIVSELDQGVQAADPTLFDDELVIVFSNFSTQNVGGGGKTDLWYATRVSKVMQFSPPRHLPDVNTGENEGDPWVSGDGCHLYYGCATGNDYDLCQADVMP